MFLQGLILRLVVGSVARFVGPFVTEPFLTVTTVLYSSNLLPGGAMSRYRGVVREDLLEPDNYVFRLTVKLMRVLW